MKIIKILFPVLLLFILPFMAFASEGAVAASDGGLKALAGALAIAIGALGGALGQGRLAAAAMEGIARNPQAGKTMFVPFIIGLALIESLVIYCLIIAFPLAQG